MIRDRADGKPRPTVWSAYGRQMLGVGALSAALALAAVGWMRWQNVRMPWQGQLAVGAGVFFTMLLTGALMGLIFASARGGHDLAVRDFDAQP